MTRFALLVPRLLGALKRRLYHNQRPTWFMRIWNRIDALLYAYGIAPRHSATLEVTGRRTARPITLPVAVTEVAGERYLVSMLGPDANWVRNVRAAHGAAVLRRRDRQPVILEEIPAAERAPVLRHYLAIAPGARPHFPVDRRAPLSAFEQISHRYPVFRIRER